MTETLRITPSQRDDWTLFERVLREYGYCDVALVGIWNAYGNVVREGRHLDEATLRLVAAYGRGKCRSQKEES